MASIVTPGPASDRGRDEPEPGTASRRVEMEMRPQAGPLPRKRGEIGFQEGMDVGGDVGDNSDSTSQLPARHPADTEASSPASGSSSASSATSPSSSSSSAAAAAAADPTTFSSADASSMHKASKRTAFLSRLDPRPTLNRIKFGGVALATVLRLVFQLTILAGTIALWIVIVKRLTSGGGSSTSSADQQPSSLPALGGSAAIFVHVTFGIVTLAQLLFLERCIFFIRAQRYAHTHHGAALPTHSRSGSPMGTGMGMAFAPWNRPSLPTYATALAQSGAGTGDVEDNIIAIPPPPAYGNTRGSTLLLAGFMRNSLRTATSQASRPVSQASRRERSISYRSQDGDWEERGDAERALRLAETLERLENTSQASGASGRAVR